MERRPLGNTGLNIAPIVFGGNVFGWTIDEKTSFEVLDAFVDYGFNAIDTADMYSTWAPGNQGGESESIIGRWLKANPKHRNQVIIFTKVGADMGGPDRKGLSRRWIMQAVEESLKRLGVDAVDLYFSHFPDPDTPEEETLRAYDDLLKAGKIKSIGTSNVDAGQLVTSLRIARENSLPAYQVLQPEYNLYDRSAFEGALRDLCLAEELGVVTYYSLASGFLSGKYRSEDDLKKSARGSAVGKYMNARGERILTALDEVAGAHRAEPVQVALAWLIAQPGVTAPIVSATSVEQVGRFAAAARLKLSDEEIRKLSAAGE